MGTKVYLKKEMKRSRNGKDPKTWQPMRGYLYLWFYRDYEKANADFNASDALTDYIDHPQGHDVDFWRGIAYLGSKDYKNSIDFWGKHIQKETILQLK